MNAHRNVKEPCSPTDPDSPLSFTMEGSRKIPPAALTGFYWSPGWNSPQAINKYQIEVGGPMHDGDPGRRLLFPEDNQKTAFLPGDSETVSASKDALTVICMHHIFGSDEISVYAPSIKQSMPAPYINMNAKEAEKYHLSENNTVELTVNNQTLQLVLKINHTLADGLVGIPAGFPGLDIQNLPANGQIRKIKQK
jgi:NADH-quinone oxidoreductase subunit G